MRELPFRAFGDAAGRNIAIARRLATFRRATFIEAAGETIDQPSALFGLAFKADIAVAERVDERRQQNRRRDHRRTDQDRQ